MQNKNLLPSSTKQLALKCLAFLVFVSCYNSLNAATIPVGPGETFTTIQAAIDDAGTLDGDVIEVQAGTYSESITVSKEVEIRGPNFGISPNTGSRVAEAIIVPGATETDVITITASNVVIDGLTIDGDNTSITTGWIGTNGADIDAFDGVVYYDTGNTIVVNSLKVRNNIFQNLSFFAVDIFGWDNFNNPSTSDHLVDDNLMRDLGTYQSGGVIDFWGGGVLLYNDNYTRITNNVMTNVRIGIQTGNFHDANPGDVMYQVIDNNTIEARRRGIFYNLHTGGSVEPLTFSNNVITGIDDANETVWDGILAASLSDATGQILNNTVDGTGISNPSEGFEVWNVNPANPVNIQGCTASNVDIGIFVNNYEGYNSNAGNTGALIDGAKLTNNVGTGIYVKDSPDNSNNATVEAEIIGNTDVKTVVTTNVTDRVGIKVEGIDASANIHDNVSTISGNLIGILVDAGDATITNNTISNNGIGIQFINNGTGTANMNVIAGNGTFGVDNQTGTLIDATQNCWGDPSGPSGEGPGTGDAVSVDVDFSSFITDSTCAKEVPIPTLSEWGLIILALSFMTLGVLYITEEKNKLQWNS
ncbi:MAG: hypothetical protein R3E32_24305 [Chitinophagales bacterium]